MSRTVHVEVTRELVDEHHADVCQPCNCPGYHAMIAAGLEVDSVNYDSVDLEDGTAIELPPEFREWQREGGRLFYRGKTSELQPISFDLEVPEGVTA